METFNWFIDFKYLNAIWLLPIIFYFHEFEEWHILDYYKKYYKNTPPVTNLSMRLFIVFVCLVATIITVIAFITGNNNYAAFIIQIIIIIAIMNGIQHIYWCFEIKSYFPGVIFASLNMIVSLLLMVKAIINGYIPIYIAIPSLFLMIPQLLITFKTKKNEISKDINGALLFSLKLEKAYRKLFLIK